jgi:hypothetical protein
MALFCSPVGAQPQARAGGRLEETSMNVKRAVIRVQLDAVAKERLDDLCDKRGMTQIAAMSRLVAWLTSQDQVVQSWALGSLSDEALSPLLRKLLQRLETEVQNQGKG